MSQDSHSNTCGIELVTQIWTFRRQLPCIYLFIAWKIYKYKHFIRWINLSIDRYNVSESICKDCQWKSDRCVCVCECVCMSATAPKWNEENHLIVAPRRRNKETQTNTVLVASIGSHSLIYCWCLKLDTNERAIRIHVFHMARHTRHR